jgi:homocysteine S-methyltransferase
MTRLDELLSRHGVVILDGGLATELERRGADLHDPLWSAKVLLDAPEMIRQVHLDYYAAGAGVATRPATRRALKALFGSWPRRCGGGRPPAPLGRARMRSARDFLGRRAAARIACAAKLGVVMLMNVGPSTPAL